LTKVTYHFYPTCKEIPKFFQVVLTYHLGWQSRTSAPVGCVSAKDVIKELILEKQAFTRSESFIRKCRE